MRSYKKYLLKCKIESLIINCTEADPYIINDANTLYIDQCAKFAECCRARLDNNDILELELAEILK